MYEIELFGSIVGDKTKDNQVTFKEIRQEMKNAEGGDLKFLINSGGGSTVQGSAMLGEMDKYEGTLHAHIIGICGSMATVVASKCQVVTMDANALYMIHNPQSAVAGEEKDMLTTANVLKNVKSNLLMNYVNKTGMSEEKISSMMDATTYMSAQEAYDLGFVDEITGSIKLTAEMEEYIFEASEVSEQAKAYFKQKNTETNMSEEKQEKGILARLSAFIKSESDEVKEPVQEPVAEVSVDFEAKCIEVEADFTAKIEAKDVELAELKASHEEAIQAKDAEMSDVVAKTEAIVKAFSEEKLTCAEVAELLASDESAEKVEAKLEVKEPHNLTDVVDKDEVEDKQVDVYAQWEALHESGDVIGAQKFYVENSQEIKNKSKEL